MEEIGKKLRNTRERLGLTLEEVERSTRIRSHHLEAMEAGELDSLPSSVQARGFLRNYTEFLGLDAEEILNQYADKLQARRVRQPRALHGSPTTQPTVQVQSSRRRWLSPDLLVAAVVAVGVMAILVWGIGRVVTLLQVRAEEAQESSAFLIPTFTPSPAATEVIQPADVSAPDSELPVPAATGLVTPTATLAIQVVGGSASELQVRILVEQRAWVRVVVDGEEVYRDQAQPGEVVEFRGQEVIELFTGNGAGVHVIFNGEDLGRLGGFGEVIIRLWTLEGMFTPTPSLSPTALPSTVTPSPTEES